MPAVQSTLVFIFLVLTLLGSCWAKVKLKLPEGDFVLDIGNSGEMSLKKAATMSNTGDIGSNSSKPPKPQQAIEKQLSVNVKNNFYNESLDVFWVSTTGDEVLMGTAAAGETLGLSTFERHTFTARTHVSHVDAHPSLITVAKGTLDYAFGPKPSASHNQAPNTMVETTPSINPTERKLFFKYLNKRSSSVAVKFRCLVPKGVDVYYEDGKGGLPQGTLKLGQEYTVNSYEGHVFFFTAQNNKLMEYARVTCTEQQVLYLITDPLNPPALSYLEHAEKEEAFRKEYLNRTGIQWRHYFGPDGPRGPPVLPMWPAQHVGQVHHVTSSEGFWLCPGPQRSCQSSDPVPLTLEVMSTHPKAFYISHFLSDVEAQGIVDIASPQIKDSFVGNRDGGGMRKSDTRTSKNTWIPRTTNHISETLFRRAEHLLNITKLDRGNTEDLQVVHYQDGQRYDAHHDWGVSGYPESRYITLLLYLNDMASEQAGGETAFPKAAGGMGIKVHPGKGSAILFYNLLEDGNGDDLALHAALPLLQGEKWLANFWVWDPKRK